MDTLNKTNPAALLFGGVEPPYAFQFGKAPVYQCPGGLAGLCRGIRAIPYLSTDIYGDVMLALHGHKTQENRLKKYIYDQVTLNTPQNSTIRAEIIAILDNTDTADQVPLDVRIDKVMAYVDRMLQVRSRRDIMPDSVYAMMRLKNTVTGIKNPMIRDKILSTTSAKCIIVDESLLQSDIQKNISFKSCINLATIYIGKINTFAN